jgi:hypothetical protein
MSLYHNVRQWGLLGSKILPCVLTHGWGQQTVVPGKTRIKLSRGLVAPSEIPISDTVAVVQPLFSSERW